MDPDNVVLDDEFIINQTNDPENELYFYHTDHLGSSSWITDASGAVNQHIQYLPFGESFISQKVSSYDVRYKFTGKERDQETGYDYFGARYYSSELSVWLSVDPLASKMPSLSPYMAFKNNPVKYIDPDGRLPIVSSVVGFIKGAFAKRSNFEKKGTTRMGNALRSAWRHEKNAWKITGGLFATDKNKSFNGKVGQIVSRFTTELPQTVLGLVSSYGANLFGKMLDVNYKAGATVSKMRGLFGAFTLGSFVIGDRMISASPDNSIFQHEYGHYLQSQATGFLYLFKYAIPSLYSAAITNRNNYYGHMYSKPEQDANKRALNYWTSTIKNYNKWNYDNNPILK